MKVRDVMSKKVVTVSPETTFREIGNIIFGKRFSRKFSSVPVVDKKGKLLGIVAEKDLLIRLYPSQREVIEDFFGTTDFYEMEEKIHEVEKLTAQELMTKNPIVTTSETPLLKAGSLMLVKRVRRLPVVDKEGRLVGIVSQGDIFRAIFSHLEKH
ncbi:MAG: hypothetical protein LiPW16_74 [Microgenomates group bacterium LiPW_16]|nr:MAG: hypothetical protein LiPW16_74 [Microgenomates group bacterium LiPW_16]